MRGSSTKIITPRSIVPKKISFNVHPSHEAAARKANQNISKLLTPSELAQKRLQRTRLVNDAGTLNVPSIPRSTPSPSASSINQNASVPSAPMTNSAPGSLPNLPPMPSTVPNGPQAYNNSNLNSLNASAAAQQIAAGMIRSGMMRPPISFGNQQSNPTTNPVITQLQQLQQLQQAHQQQQQQQQQHQQQQQQFSDSPLKSTANFRSLGPGQIRPPSVNGPINFMNLPPGITPLQMQQLQQKNSQANQLLQQQQASQMQQMYAKSIQARPVNTLNLPNAAATIQTNDQEETNSNNLNLRTSPRKSSNK